MSQENVESMRGVIDAFNRRDVEALSALLAPDVEIVPIRAALEDIAYRGPDAASQWFAAVDEAWENLTVEHQEMRDAGGVVLARGRVRSHGRGSGAAIDVEGTAVAWFRDGLIQTMRIFTDRDRALEAAGLSE